MAKSPTPLSVDDLTVFCRSLSRQLGEVSPSHLTLMNMLARAAGYQNLQHMRSAHAAKRRLDRRVAEQIVDARTVERCLHQFDAAGRLRQWPSKRSTQTLALWALWARLPADRSMHEREVCHYLREEHLFDDPAILRRTMISCRMLTRSRDGADYRRIEQEPPAEAKALFRVLAERWRARLQPGKERTDA